MSRTLCPHCEREIGLLHYDGEGTVCPHCLEPVTRPDLVVTEDARLTEMIEDHE